MNYAKNLKLTPAVPPPLPLPGTLIHGDDFRASTSFVGEIDLTAATFWKHHLQHRKGYYVFNDPSSYHASHDGSFDAYYDRRVAVVPGYHKFSILVCTVRLQKQYHRNDAGCYQEIKFLAECHGKPNKIASKLTSCKTLSAALKCR